MDVVGIYLLGVVHLFVRVGDWSVVSVCDV